METRNTLYLHVISQMYFHVFKQNCIVYVKKLYLSSNEPPNIPQVANIILPSKSKLLDDVWFHRSLRSSLIILKLSINEDG